MSTLTTRLASGFRLRQGFGGQVSRTIVSVIAIAVSVGAGQAPAPPAQDPPKQPPFRSEANFVRVDVYPTSDGHPVLDLGAADFQVLEDNVPQSVQTFEHVVVRPAGPQDARVEPNSIGQSLQMAANPRNRVFVIFIDQPHVSVDGSWHAREPLIRLIDRILGPDDLVGIMTQGMSAADLTLARKTEVIQGGLRNIWPWGERFTLRHDEQEFKYEACYPEPVFKSLVKEMIDRRRERLTLDALNELVLYLHNIREERKAILTVSEGWLLYRPNDDMVRLRVVDPTTGQTEQVPRVDPIGVGPDGRITTRDTRNNPFGVSKAECDGDRQHLAMINDWQYFRDIMGEANRSNASFYTVDPRGLPVFDAPLGPDAPPPVTVDFANLKNRLDSLRMLAENTDGMAVLNNNDLDAGLKRISDDLSSYYLLGYYSTNTRLDGKFRNIKVRVTRPGVEVRARKGYLAATEKEVTAARKAAAGPVPEMTSTMATALGSLDRVRPGIRLYLNATPGSAGGGQTTIWVAGEILPAATGDSWARGGTVDVEVSGQGTSETARVTLAPGDRGFVVPVKLSKSIDSGSLEVRARLSGPDASPEQASVGVAMNAASSIGRPLLFRRGPTTGNRLQAVATFQFSRTDRARLEVALASGVTPGAARLLDRTGQPLAIPVTIGERTDAQTGQRWLTADVTLAALAPADYAIEVTASAPGGEQRLVTAIRVGR